MGCRQDFLVSSLPRMPSLSQRLVNSIYWCHKSRLLMTQEAFYEFAILGTWLVLENLMFYSYFSQGIRFLGTLLADDFNSNDTDLVKISSIVLFLLFERFIHIYSVFWLSSYLILSIQFLFYPTTIPHIFIFAFLSLFKPTEFSQHWLNEYVCRDIYMRVRSLSSTTSLKLTVSPINHKLPIALQIEIEHHDHNLPQFLKFVWLDFT